MRISPPYVEAVEYIRVRAVVRAVVRDKLVDAVVLGWRADRVYLTWRTDLGKHLGWLPASDVQRC